MSIPEEILKQLPDNKEYIRITPEGMEVRLTVVVGNDLSGTFLCISPSINVSGYGNTQREATTMFKIAMQDLWEGYQGLQDSDIINDLQKYGWSHESIKYSIYSKVFVDHDGLLQNLINPFVINSQELLNG